MQLSKENTGSQEQVTDDYEPPDTGDTTEPTISAKVASILISWTMSLVILIHFKEGIRINFSKRKGVEGDKLK